MKKFIVYALIIAGVIGTLILFVDTAPTTEGYVFIGYEETTGEWVLWDPDSGDYRITLCEEDSARLREKIKEIHE